MIDSIREVVVLAGSYVNWESVGLWFAFLFSFPVALFICFFPKVVIEKMGEGSALLDKIFGWGLATTVIIGLPLCGLLLSAAWTKIDVLPMDWEKHGFFGGLWLLARAIAGHWMRLVYSGLPIILVFLPFLLLCDTPAINKKIESELEEAKRKKAEESTSNSDRQDATTSELAVDDRHSSVTVVENHQSRHGLIPEPPEGEKLPEGWTYRPETPGGH